MLRRPPTPPRPDTLSPYTTLLRSGSGGVVGPVGRALRNSGPAFDSARAVSAGNATAGVLFGPFGAAVYGADRLQQPAHPQTHRARSEEHTSELQSLMRISYAVLCLKKKNNN